MLATLANTAAADDRDLCNDAKADREKRLAACAGAPERRRAMLPARIVHKNWE